VHTAPHAGTPSGQGIQPAACALFTASLLDFVEFRLHKILHQAIFQKLKWFRRIATRYDKLDASFLAFVYIAAITILLI